MFLKFRFKSFFVIFIIIIFAILIGNYYTKNKNVKFKTASDAEISDNVKTIGVKIEHNQLNGEKIEITADEMVEDGNNKFIKLINPITIITKNNEQTEITSNMALVKDNNNEFFLKNNVKIYNPKKNFLLITNNLKGYFKTGKMNTKDVVNIKVQNIYIKGSGLSLTDYGNYIKIFGKAKLKIN